MKVGFCQLDITPPLGSESPGFFEKRVFWDVHDPLHVKAAVFEEAASRVALVGVDSLSIKASTVRKAREMAERMSGIPAGSILVAASHDHQGGPTVEWAGNREMVLRASEDKDLMRRLLDTAPAADPSYIEFVAERIASAVTLADRRKVEALCAVGVGREESVSFNRRFKMKNGRQMTHPGKGSPDIVEPAGPIDPDVGVLSAWSTEGKFLGCVVNFACHGTTLNVEAFSADWPYYLDRTVRAAMGQDSVVVFLNGACGDVTQVDNQSMREAEFGEKWCRRVGTKVGAEALKVIAEAEPAELSPVKSSREVIQLERRAIPDERLRRSKEEVERTTPRQNPEWVFARDTIILSELLKLERSVPCEIQAIQIGPAAFVSSPAELFCELGLRIKQASSFPFTFVVELANGCVGYVPTREAMGPSGGGYETRMGMHSFLTPRAGEAIVEKSVEILSGFNPPKSKAVRAKRGKPWAYGSIGPEEV